MKAAMPRDLVTKAARAVDYPRAELFEMLEIAGGVVNAVSVPARVRRRAHAVEKQRVPAVAVFLDVEVMSRCIDAFIRRAAALKFGEQTREPLRVLVIDGDRKFQFGHSQLSLTSAQKTKRPLDVSGLETLWI